MGGATKGFSNVGNSFSSVVRGKGNLRDFLNVTPVGAAGQIIANGVGIDPNKVFSGGVLSGGGQSNPYVSGPFSLDPEQLSGDQSSIKYLGDKQYADTLEAIDKNSEGQQQYAGDTLNRMLPNIYEDMNARHLLTSSATGQEVGKQASYLAQDLASQRANAIQQALVGKQSYETGALQRGLSLEDFVNQANVAKTIGAQMAPQVGNGKGTAVSGLGAGATAGTAIMPGWGTAIGAGLGYLGGGGLNGGSSRGGK